MTAKQLIINCSPIETRVALIESGQLAEFYIERNHERSLVGSIFKGRISKVLPGIQSAFVDIGIDRSAFLFAGDIHTGQEKTPPEFLEDLPIPDDDNTKEEEPKPKKFGYKQYKISEMVKEGQEVLVQVAKESIGNKGARITTYLSLPGRYVVLMPDIPHIGVSRRIGTEEERTRLKNLIAKIKPEGTGIIVRTASENISDEKITADVEFLAKIWETIKSKNLKSPTPSLLYEDLDLVFRCTRDLLSKDLDRIVIDDQAKYENLVKFLNRFSVKLGAQVQLYQEKTSIFDAYGIEKELNRALGPKVWLRSGGYLVIQQTEALTAVDVNTGKFVGGKSQNDTIVRTNLEAAKEIVQQLRLRNIGGIIILDFIDMDRPEDRERVFNLLVEELKKDKARTTALRISEFGLVQMTRKRTEESLSQKLSQPCSYCEGKGFVKSAVTIAFEVLRELQRMFKTQNGESVFEVQAHHEITDRLCEADADFLTTLKTAYGKQVIVTTKSDFHIEHFEILSH